MTPAELQRRISVFSRLLDSPSVRTEIHRAMTYVLRGQVRIQRAGRLDSKGRRMTTLAPVTKRQRQRRGKPVSDRYPELLSLWDAFLRPSRNAVLSWNPRRGRLGTTNDIYPYHHDGNPRLPRRRILGIMSQPYDTPERLRGVLAAMLQKKAQGVGLRLETEHGSDQALREAENESAR